MLSIRKTIAFPKSIVEAVEAIAQRWDMDFADYIRYQAVKIAEQEKERPTHYMSEKTESNVETSRKEIQEGQSKTFKDGKSFMKYLSKKK